MAVPLDAPEPAGPFPGQAPDGPICPDAPAAARGGGDRGGHWVSVRVAAAYFGTSRDTVRSRAAAGVLLARREPLPGGYRWLVFLPRGAGAAAADPPPPGGAAGRRGAATGLPDPGPLADGSWAAALAKYTADLLEPWRARVEALSRENGRLQGERDAAWAALEQARAEAAAARRELEALRGRPPPSAVPAARPVPCRACGRPVAGRRECTACIVGRKRHPGEPRPARGAAREAVALQDAAAGLARRQEGEGAPARPAR
jgi:hypothetical protein